MASEFCTPVSHNRYASSSVLEDKLYSRTGPGFSGYGSWSGYDPRDVWSDPIFQEEWRRLQEENRLKQEASFKDRPHYLVVNPFQYTTQASSWSSENGLPTSRSSPQPKEEYVLSSCPPILVHFSLLTLVVPFGPIDSWGYQHALSHPKCKPYPELELHADLWRNEPGFEPLHDDPTPWYPVDSLKAQELAQIQADEELWEERREAHYAKYGDSAENIHRGSPQEQEIDEARRLEAQLVNERQTNALAESERSQSSEPQPSEPAEPSLQSVVEAVTVHQATKKKQKRKQPLVMKTKYVSIHNCSSHY